MDLNLVALFAKVVETGSFTAAGLARGLPKSSVSRAIARLEERLGVRLLTRTTRKLSLTTAGTSYLQGIREPLAQLGLVSGCVAESGQIPRGLVRITIPPELDEPGFAPFLASFLQRYPEVHVEVIVTNRRVDLVAENVDLALRAGKLEDSSLISRRLLQTQMGLFATPRYLDKRGKPKRLADLKEHACVIFRGVGGRIIWQLVGPRGTEAVEVKGPVNVDDLGVARSLALCHVGIGLFPTMAVSSMVSQGRLVRVLPAYSMSGGWLQIVSASLRHMPLRVSLLRDHLVKSAGEFVPKA